MYVYPGSSIFIAKLFKPDSSTNLDAEERLIQKTKIGNFTLIIQYNPIHFYG